MNGAPIIRAKILIIDDSRDVRSILRELLTPHHTCTESGSAEEALVLLKHEKFDLVISDISMGEMSGLEMIPHLLALAPETVVVLISGQNSIESAIEAMRVGAFDYIVKPFDLQHVEAAVDRALEHHFLLQAKRRHDNHLEELVTQRTADLNYLAYHDALTDLPNRVLFEDRLKQALGLAQHEDRPVGMLFLSLDRFKKVHDTLGHGQGFQLLKEVAYRLRKCIHESETLARFEGDEFALLLVQPGGTDGVVEVIYQINEALSLPFTLDNHELFMTASIGVSLYPNDGLDATTLLQNAGAALYRAKEQGGNNYQFYTADMNAKALKRLVLEGNLRRALERCEFEVHYQPQLEFKSGQVTGMEALVRWRHPEMGLISPMEFIPLAEDTGLIVPLGEWVMRTACTQGKAWHDAGLGPLSFAVNLSARQFEQEDLSNVIASILRETGLDPRFLELELTESSIMKNAESTVGTLNRLKDMGVRISIDDFGTGYSSLSYLKRLPIDVLKIDSSFVRDVTTNPDDAALVVAIITLAHNLRLDVIAEGVETADQLEFLARLGCDKWQGFLFSRALPAAEIRDLLEEATSAKEDGAYARLA